MKKTIILLALFASILISIKAQTYKQEIVYITLNDTVVFFNDAMDDARDKSGRITNIAFDLDDVWAGCSDASIAPGYSVFEDDNGDANYPVVLFARYRDNDIPYMVSASDTLLQPDGTYKNIKPFWVDDCPGKDQGVEMDQGSCPDDIIIPVYIFYGTR